MIQCSRGGFSGGAERLIRGMSGASISRGIVSRGCCAGCLWCAYVSDIVRERMPLRLPALCYRFCSVFSPPAAYVRHVYALPLAFALVELVRKLAEALILFEAFVCV